MAGIPQPFFDWDDSIPDFLAKLRLYLQNQGVDPADNAGGPPTGREVAIGYLKGYMRGRALEWFDEEITTKQNWELANLLDNTGQANLVVVNGRNAGQIGNQALNEAFGQPGTAIVKLKAVESPWNEDWRIADGRPANIAVNALNANNGTTVVVAGIRFGQAIWWLKTHFPTVEEELRDLMYRTIRKGNMTIDELPEELRRKFLDALPLSWLEKAEDIGEHLPLDKLAKKLYEIELRRIARHKKDRLPDPLVSNRASQEIYEPSPVSAPQQQGISLEDMQKAIQNALAQQKTENQALVKKVTELQSQMAQQVSTPQTVEPVRQPKGPPSSLKTEEGLKNYYVSEYLKEIGLLSKEDLDSDYPVKPFQRPRPQRNNNSARFDRIEEGLEETQNNVNEPRGASYKLTGDTNAISPLESSQPETYDQLLSKLSPPIRKMCLSRKAQEEETKESDDEFGGINDPAIKALGWKADKPSNFAIKGNSKHITDSLGWYTDVPVTLKDKEDKTVTVIGNFVRIDNGETEPMLFFGMSNIQKQGSGSQGSAKRGAGPSIYDSSSLTGEKDLKKMHKLYEL
ncbi:hypothetical protein RirG_114840 [Rhizophagus irregularis DAOM 197198w]|uniref:Uncharacterized protein n=1 Tax=Rhizophagus irregularis (strain DAOM 197198w) TaxID=1432141 RepID=A0A015KIL1_RHIIW|nr:hypothetical protein RirG_114840 [Rhizophagus irregularis DAOM 197198w]